MGHRLRVRMLSLGLIAALLASNLAGLGGATAAKPSRPGTDPSCPVEGGAQIVLDPGHGGSDSGAVNGELGLVEKDLNLWVAQRAAQLLSGTYTVALTRSGDQELGNSERGKIANVCGAQAFVSIHFNSSNDETINYTKTFWGKRRKDEAFSQHMNQVIFPALQHDAQDNLTNLENGGTWQFATGSLLQADAPSTLVEAVFLSNPEEAGRLADGTGSRQAQIAQAIAAGAAGWLGS